MRESPSQPNSLKQVASIDQDGGKPKSEAIGLAWLYALIDYFIPPFNLRDLQQVDRHRRAKILVTFCFLAGLTSICVPLTLAGITGDLNPRRLAIAAFGLLLISNPLLMKLTGRFEPVAYLFYIESGLVMGGQTLFMGGIQAPTLVIFLLWPLGAFFIVGRSLGVFTSLLVAAFLSLLLLHPETVASLVFYPSDDPSKVLFACFCAVLAFSAVVNWTYETFQANFRTTTAKLLNELKKSQAALLDAKLSAEAANAAKSEFLAHMSHEIRTPMNGVLGMAALLDSSDLSPDHRDMARTITTSSEALLKILNDILDLSKVEAGKLELDPHPFNLRIALEDVLDLVAPQALAKGVEVLLDYSDDVPEAVYGDETRTRQILTNLLGNAVKFTAEGEINLKARYRGAETGFEISVTDTGIGIPEEQQQRLFTSYTQANAQIANRYGGTGLGLSISRHLAQLMGGDLRLESQPGRGSTFVCDLRLTLDPDRQPTTRALLSHSDATLLLVPNATLARVLQHQLQAWGFHALVAPTAEDAEQVLTENPDIKLVLWDEGFDGGIPVPGGQSQPLSSLMAHIPVLALCQPTASQVEAQANIRLLQKPVHKAQLYEALRIALAKEHESPEASQRVLKLEHVAQRWPLRLLVADDNLVNRKVADRMLQRMGYRATLVEHGRAAVDALAAEPFDLILMDIEMPWLNGMETTQLIRETFSEADQPSIVALTANAMAGDRERFLAAGMNDYLSKPLTLEALRAVIERQAGARAPTRIAS